MSRRDARWLSRTRVSDLAGSYSRQLTHEHVYTITSVLDVLGYIASEASRVFEGSLSGAQSGLAHTEPAWEVQVLPGHPVRRVRCQHAETLVGVRSELQPSASYETSTGLMLGETFTLAHAFILYKFTVHRNRVK